jgi:hypothetical protein
MRGGGRNAYRVLVGKPEGKKLPGRPRRREKGKIRIELNEIEWGNVDWIFLAQDRDKKRAVLNMAMKSRVP